jgi:hypothetical protein
MCAPCRRLAFIEDFEFLIAVGCGWQEVSARLHLSPDAIERRLNRARRNDLEVRWRQQVRDGGTWQVSGWQTVRNQQHKRATRAATRRQKVAA